MSDLGMNIRRLRQQANLTLEQLAANAEVDPSNLSKIERGVGGFSKESIDRIAKALGVSIGTLFAEGDPIEEPDTGARRRVPVLDDSAIKNYIGSRGMVTRIWAHAEHVPMDIKDSPRLFAVRNKNAAMTPDLQKDDILVIDPQLKPEPGDFVVADCGDEGINVRQYRVRSIGKGGSRVVELAALNPAYPSFSSADSSIIVLGTVVEHRRRWK